MILYSVTISIDKEAEAEWLRWMKETYIPSAQNSGLLADHKVLRLLTEVQENEGSTYSFQYYFKNMQDYDAFETIYSAGVDRLLYDRYSGRFVEFRTLLEVV